MQAGTTRDFAMRLLSLRGLITVPGAIALALWAVAVATLWIDRDLLEGGTARLPRLLDLPYETALAVLSTITSTAITTLSLVYSLVLVVFTLAAGNIAPRLLKRFTNDRVNQVTAGLLGGTFLFSLTILHRTEPNFVPPSSIAVAYLFAALSVSQLIYFVHSVSRRVTIDEEIAEISRRLKHQLSNVVRRNEENDRRISRHKIDYPAEFPHSIKSTRTGYVARIDEDRIVRLATENDVFVELAVGHGGFVLPGQTLARLSRPLDRDTAEQAAEVIAGAIEVARSRGSVDDIEFAVSILLEIALRALSPGTNDTFTAIACTDRLSAALLDPVTKGLRNNVLLDRDDVPRLRVPGLTLPELIDAAFHPLRRAASDNLLMLLHLADALMRLHEIADGDDTKRLLREHGRILIASYEAEQPLQADLEILQQRLAAMLAPDRVAGPGQRRLPAGQRDARTRH